MMENAQKFKDEIEEEPILETFSHFKTKFLLCCFNIDHNYVYSISIYIEAVYCQGIIDCSSHFKTNIFVKGLPPDKKPR